MSTLRQDGLRFHSSRVAAANTTNSNNRSAMTMCSSWISNPLNKIGTVARVAIQPRTRARRSSA